MLSHISEVLTVLRQNARFATSNGYTEAPLLASFRSLRDTVRSSSVEDFEGLSRLELLTPFLDVVKSDQTSGPFTGAALEAIIAFLQFQVLPSPHSPLSHMPSSRHKPWPLSARPVSGFPCGPCSPLGFCEKRFFDSIRTNSPSLPHSVPPPPLSLSLPMCVYV